MALRPFMYLRTALDRRNPGEAFGPRSVPARSGRDSAAVSDDIDALLAQVQLAYEQQSRLIRGIGHDFKSPLASILRLSEALAEGEFGPMDAEQSETARVIASSARHLMAIAQALYAVGGAREEESMTGRAEVDLITVVQRVVDAHASAARAKRIELRAELPAGELPVCATQGAVERILGNIIGNAVKFTFTGSVSIALTREGDTVVVVVEDTGIGIPADEIPSIGVELVRGSNAGEVSGSGVGLAVARYLLEGIGGGLEIASTLDSGSRFTVRIPVSASPGTCS